VEFITLQIYTAKMGNFCQKYGSSQRVPMLLLEGKERPEREVNHSSHSVQRLRMSGGVPVLPVYAFRVSQGKLYLIYGSP
jgi:hypothetical protein